MHLLVLRKTENGIAHKVTKRFFLTMDKKGNHCNDDRFVQSRIPVSTWTQNWVAFFFHTGNTQYFWVISWEKIEKENSERKIGISKKFLGMKLSGKWS